MKWLWRFAQELALWKETIKARIGMERKWTTYTPTQPYGPEYGGLSELSGSSLQTTVKSSREMGENAILKRCVVWTRNFEEQVS